MDDDTALFWEDCATGSRGFYIVGVLDDAEEYVIYLNSKNDGRFYWVEYLPNLKNIKNILNNGKC